MKEKHLHMPLRVIQVCIGRWSSHCQSIYLYTLSVRCHQSWRFLGFFWEFHNWVPYTPPQPLHCPSCYKFSPIGRRERPPLCQSSCQSHWTIWLNLESSLEEVLYLKCARENNINISVMTFCSHDRICGKQDRLRCFWICGIATKNNQKQRNCKGWLRQATGRFF